MLSYIKAILASRKVANFAQNNAKEIITMNIKSNDPKDAKQILDSLINPVLEKIKSDIACHDENVADEFATTFLYSAGRGLYKKLQLPGLELKGLFNWTDDEYKVFMVKDQLHIAHKMWSKV